jgi:hypothetical protein
VPGEVPAGELGERGAPVHGGLRLLSEPVADERVGLLAPGDRPAQGEPALAREPHEVVDRLPLVRTPAAATRAAIASRPSGPSSVSAASMTATPALGGAGRQAVVGEPLERVGLAGGGGQRVQPRQVLAADHVQRPAVEPLHHEGPVLGQRPVDRRRRQAGRARAERQPCRPKVLGLDGQEPARDVLRRARRGVEEALRRQPRGVHLGGAPGPAGRPPGTVPAGSDSTTTGRTIGRRRRRS